MSDPLEIVCDESGADGENLIGGNTDVFAHAGVRMPLALAAEHLVHARELIRSPATQYKANHFLRSKHRDALVWLLSEEGPLYGRAHVHLTDKVYFALLRLTELLLPGEDGAGRADAARLLYRAGRSGDVEPTRWRDFLRATGDLMRVRTQEESPVDAFYARLAALRTPAARAAGGDPGHPDGLDALDGMNGMNGMNGMDTLLDAMVRARPHAEAFRARLPQAPATVPVLDPFLPALAATVTYWSAPDRPVTIAHDRQNTLTEDRLAWLRARTGTRLAALRFTDPDTDPRIQLADFLAGTARKLASDELAATADPELLSLLRPFVDEASVWGGDPFWLTPTGGAPV
ncbi:hypothetical protein ACFQLX_18895 [Streptomyces polyrhachis]|uniref:DUF3800 domain-containing protein n=1 Tax=Streptomyces polyrhachis TaxID=1282885 RepID=A0ABW2GHN4_9ACTN